jgi:DHA1 family multidrug resistance protein-like MFS transporter
MRGLYVVAAVTMAGVSSVFVLLAELQHRYDLPTAGLGWIAGSAFLAALATQLTLARYADRGYGTLLLRAGVVAAAAGLLWFAAATELWEFVLARALLGAGVGMIIPPARRAIVLTAGDKQGEQLGVFYAAYIAGFVFGPPVAGALTAVGDVRLPFLVLGILVALTLFSIRDLEMPPAAESTDAAGAPSKRVLRRLLAMRKVVAALLVIVSFRYSIGVFEPLWATYLDDLGASTLLITLSLTGFALPMLIIAKRAGRLSDRFGPRVTSVGAALVTAPIMASYGFVSAVPIIMLMALPHGIMEAIQSPGTQAAVADASPHEDAAAAQGLGEAAGSAAAAIGALTAAPLFSWLGSGPTWLIAGLVMASLLTVSALLDPPVIKRRPVTAVPSAELAELNLLD